jgi:cobalt/nickel transport system ATP-binding protein
MREKAPAVPVATLTSSPAPAIVVEDLRYSYPDGTEALRGVSFSIDPGESIAIIGPNGAGKSTLILHLNGILRGEGSIRVLGTPLEDRTLRDIRRKVGIVFQDPEDQLFLTRVAQDVAFGPANMGLSEPEIDERVREALAAVGMEGFADRSTHLLSFGEKKRIATATVLAMRPDVLVLDEPTSNLDPKARRQLINILLGLPVTKIIVTHDLPVTYEICTRALILSQGRIAADGPIGEILADSDLLQVNGLELPYGFLIPKGSNERELQGQVGRDAMEVVTSPHDRRSERVCRSGHLE